MRVALVHDWLVQQRGGENVLLELARLFPQASIYTLVYLPGSVHPELEAHPIYTSFIQKLPGSPKKFRAYLPLFFAAMRSFDLSQYDLVISSSHCVAQGVRTTAKQRHIAYIHTPMRYLWHELRNYLPWQRETGWRRYLGRCLYAVSSLGVRPFRYLDREAAKRPDLLLANSQYIAQRIAEHWGRTAKVLYPPVEVAYFAEALSNAVATSSSTTQRQGYLSVGALVPYKCAYLAVRLALQEGFKLTVVGSGPEQPRLERLVAAHPEGGKITFKSGLTRAELRTLYATSAGLLHMGTEDFGIIPVEAQAAGCPVLAYKAGGLLETVNRTYGAFFKEPTLASLSSAYQRWRGDPHLPRAVVDAAALALSQSMQVFSSANFRTQLQEILQAELFL